MNIKKIAKRIGWSLLILVVLIYIGVGVWFKLNERKLAYHTDAKNLTPPDSLQLNYSEITVDMPQETKLVCGVMESSKTDSSSSWILYLHGNGGFDKGDIERCKIFHDLGFNILAVHYRGFGKGTGEASEQGLYSDGEAAYNFLTTARDAFPSKIIIYGHSMGCAIATMLATKVSVAGLAIEGAFTSEAELAWHYMPYYPWSLLITERLASIDRIGNITAPKLLIHATDDQAVPISFGRELFAKAVEPKTFLELVGGHNLAPAMDQEKFKPAFSEFSRKAIH